MSGSEKIWVIDVEEGPDPSLPGKAQSGTQRSHQKSSTSRDKPRRERKYFVTLLGLTYLLGPLALLLTPQGRRNRIWLAAALGSGLAGLVMLWRWQDILSRIESGSPILFWSVVTSLVILTGFTTWARAIYLTGENADRPAQRWPRWLMKPWAIGGLGFLVPGLGLLLAGCRKRAVAVLWLYWPAVLSVLLLAHATWMWDWQRNSGVQTVSANTIEYIMMIAAMVAFLGVLGWIAQALDGARQVSSQYSAWVRPRSDWYAAALMGAIVVLAVVSEPASIAKRLDRLGGSLRREGYQVIPLCLTLTANRLDPSRPVYVMQAIELYDELGKSEAAARLQDELNEDMQPYLMMLRESGVYGRDITPTSWPRYDLTTSRLATDGEHRVEYIIGPFLNEAKAGPIQAE